MINVIDPITALSLLTLASMEPSAVCQMPRPTQINIIPRSADVQYDISQTRDEIQKYNIDTINPYGFEANTHTNGFMRGKISMQPSVKLDYKYVLANQGLCIWYDEIELNIAITPEIVIAKEVAEDPCEYKATKRHELKHVMVDRKIVNKYAKTMGKKLFNGLKSRGFLVGPIKIENAKDVSKRMQDTVVKLIEWEYKKMEIERAEKQQEIDSLKEYERVNSICDKRGVTGASRTRSQYN